MKVNVVATKGSECQAVVIPIYGYLWYRGEIYLHTSLSEYSLSCRSLSTGTKVYIGRNDIVCPVSFQVLGHNHF